MLSWYEPLSFADGASDLTHFSFICLLLAVVVDVVVDDDDDVDFDDDDDDDDVADDDSEMCCDLVAKFVYTVPCFAIVYLATSRVFGVINDFDNDDASRHISTSVFKVSGNTILGSCVANTSHLIKSQ